MNVFILVNEISTPEHGGCEYHIALANISYETIRLWFKTKEAAETYRDMKGWSAYSVKAFKLNEPPL